jgi:hypothetical protein
VPMWSSVRVPHHGLLGRAAPIQVNHLPTPDAQVNAMTGTAPNQSGYKIQSCLICQPTQLLLAYFLPSHIATSPLLLI